MNIKSIYKVIVSGEKSPRIAGRTILGIILVGTLFVTAAIVYSRAATQQVNPVISAIEAPLTSNPEVMLARRYSAAQDRTAALDMQAANPELRLARRSAVVMKTQLEASKLLANPELALAHRSAIVSKPLPDQGSLAANPELALAHRYAAVKKPAEASLLAANPELILARRFGKEMDGKEMESKNTLEYLAANPELTLVRRYTSTLSNK